MTSESQTTPVAGIDCTEIIDMVIEKTASKNEENLKDMKIQINNQNEKIDKLMDTIKTLGNLMQQKHTLQNEPSDDLNAQKMARSKEGGLNVSLETRQNVVNVSGLNAQEARPTDKGFNVSPETQPEDNDGHQNATQGNIRHDAISINAPINGALPQSSKQHRRSSMSDISLNASNLWFQGIQGSSSKVSESEKGGSGDGVEPESRLPPSEDKDQAYWNLSTLDYMDETNFDAEISSSIAGAAKCFWQKSMREGKMKEKLEIAKIPENCQFLKTKEINKPVWTILAGSQRTIDKAIQDIQKMYASSVALTLKAASEMTYYLRHKEDHSRNSELDIETPLSMLKDSLSIAGKVNQTINQFRRNLVRPSLPSQFAKLADKVDESSEWLFGDCISATVESLEKENQLNTLLKERKVSGKRKYSDQPSNYKSSSKAQKRTTDNGQNYKSYPQQQPSKQKHHHQTYNNNTHKQYNQSSKKPHQPRKSHYPKRH